MTPNQIEQLARLLRERREALELSAPQVARRARIDPSTYWRIESGQIANPKIDNLKAIADVLEISPANVFFAIVGPTSGDALPTLRTYLCAKYDVPPNVLEKIEVFFAALSEEHGICFDARDSGANHRHGGRAQ